MKYEKRNIIDWLFNYREPDPAEALKPKLPAAEAPWEYGQWHYTWQANGMLQSVQKPDGTKVTFEYDALGRRTAKIVGDRINRYVYDGNVLLHEWHYALEDRPKAVLDEAGMPGIDKTEPVKNLTTWVFEEGTFIPQAKITEKGTYSILTDYLGTPVQAFDENGTQVRERELDIYGKARVGDSVFCPWGFQNQYYDEETGLCYNRFRYYDPGTGGYISKDPIGLAGNNPNLYAYVFDSNSEVDVFGLEKIVRYGSEAEADASKKVAGNGGLSLKPGHESQPKWVGKEGTINPGTLGKSKNYTRKIEFEVDKGTIEWMKQEGFEIKPTNEPGRFAIPADRLDEFNNRVKKTTIYKKNKSGKFSIKCK